MRRHGEMVRNMGLSTLSGSKSQQISMADLLAHYFRQEQVVDNHAALCYTCGGVQYDKGYQRQVFLGNLGSLRQRMLAFEIDRYDPLYKTKIQTAITDYQTITLSADCQVPRGTVVERQGKIRAVMCHNGNLGAGHYWAWIWDATTQQWWKYNDNIVTPGTLTKLHPAHIKCLFYEIT